MINETPKMRKHFHGPQLNIEIVDVEKISTLVFMSILKNLASRC